MTTIRPNQPRRALGAGLLLAAVCAAPVSAQADSRSGIRSEPEWTSIGQESSLKHAEPAARLVR